MSLQAGEEANQVASHPVPLALVVLHPVCSAQVGNSFRRVRAVRGDASGIVHNRAESLRMGVLHKAMID